jgi:hypothetical protein
VRVSKIPAQKVLIVLVATASETCRNPALGMEGVHSVQPLAEAARGDGSFNHMRELPLDGFPARAALIATHRAIFNTRGAAKDQVLLEFAKSKDRRP